MKTIKVVEEFQIPGTGVILEEGDKIHVLRERSYLQPQTLEMLLDIVRPVLTDTANIKAIEDWGQAFMSDLDNGLGDQIPDENVLAMFRGMKKGIPSSAK